MKLDADFAGMRLKEFQTDITWRRTMNYAAATNDLNPVYFDEAGFDISRPDVVTWFGKTLAVLVEWNLVHGVR